MQATVPFALLIAVVIWHETSRVVYRGWYFGWYWLVFRWYHTNQYQRKTRLVDFGITNLAGAYYRGVRLATSLTRVLKRPFFFLRRT